MFYIVKFYHFDGITKHYYYKGNEMGCNVFTGHFEDAKAFNLSSDAFKIIHSSGLKNTLVIYAVDDDCPFVPDTIKEEGD